MSPRSSLQSLGGSPVSDGVGEENYTTKDAGGTDLTLDDSVQTVAIGTPFAYRRLSLQADARKGVYNASFRPDTLHPMSEGEYKVTLLLGREEINGSPLRYHVLPSEAFAPNCTLHPPKVAYVHDIGSLPVEVELRTYDLWGNTCIQGGASIKVLGRMEKRDVMKRELMAPKDNHDGTYTIGLEQRAPGIFELEPLVNNLQVPKVKFEFTIPIPKSEADSEQESDSV